MKFLILLYALVMAVMGMPQSNTDNLGFLVPQTVPANQDFTAIMLDLLPEFSSVLKNFGGAQGAQLSPTQAVSVFFPIVRKALQAKAQSEGRTLARDEERLLTLSETSIKLSTGVIENLSVNDSVSNIITNVMSIARPIIEANAVSQGRALSQKEEQDISQIEGAVQLMDDLTKDNSTVGIIASNLRLARFVMEAQARAQQRTLSKEEEISLNQIGGAINTAVEIIQDFNGFGNDLAKMIPTFMRLSRFLYEARASNESRNITPEEVQQLRFTEITLTNALGFIQEMVTGSASQDSLTNFITTTRRLFEQRAINQGRTTVSTDIENNLKLTERALNLALSVMGEMKITKSVVNQQNFNVQHARAPQPVGNQHTFNVQRARVTQPTQNQHRFNLQRARVLHSSSVQN